MLLPLFCRPGGYFPMMVQNLQEPTTPVSMIQMELQREMRMQKEQMEKFRQ